MRILLRASDFCSDREKQISSCKIETGFLCEIECGDRARVIFLFARVIQQLKFGLRRIKPTSTTTAMSGAAKRRAECILLGPGLKHPRLR